MFKYSVINLAFVCGTRQEVEKIPTLTRSRVNQSRSQRVTGGNSYWQVNSTVIESDCLFFSLRHQLIDNILKLFQYQKPSEQDLHGCILSKNQQTNLGTT